MWYLRTRETGSARHVRCADLRRPSCSQSVASSAGALGHPQRLRSTEGASDMSISEQRETTMTRMSVSLNPGPRERLEDVAQGVEVRGALSTSAPRRAYVLCDGVGGGKGGHVGAQLTADMFLDTVVSALTPLAAQTNGSAMLESDVLAAMKQAAQRAHEAVCQRAAVDPTLRGMATTCVCAAELEDRLLVLWAGDSRCYIDDGTQLKQITRDHSQVTELMDAGLLVERDTSTHPDRHVITRYIGGPRCCEPEVCECQLASGDVVLLCSDGLTDVMSDAQIHQVIVTCLSGAFPITELAPRLVRDALRAGTHDNVSVLCGQHDSFCVSARKTLTHRYLENAAEAVSRIQESNHAC